MVPRQKRALRVTGPLFIGLGALDLSGRLLLMNANEPIGFNNEYSPYLGHVLTIVFFAVRYFVRVSSRRQAVPPVLDSYIYSCRGWQCADVYASTGSRSQPSCDMARVN
jgi:hypothetical protein